MQIDDELQQYLTVNEVRLKNALELIDGLPPAEQTQAAIGKKLKLAQPTVANLLKSPAGFGASSARKFEQAYSLTTGYMDHYHDDLLIDTVKLATCLENVERYIAEQQFQDFPRAKRVKLVAEFYAVYPAKISHQKLGAILAGVDQDSGIKRGGRQEKSDLFVISPQG